MISSNLITYIDEFVFKGRQGLSVLDMGPQNAINLTPEYIADFLNRYGRPESQANVLDLAQKFHDSSMIKPGVRTLFLGEVFDHTTHEYLSIDVCPGHNTTIIDLNKAAIPVSFRQRFDLVLNLGTTEHIVNQFNSFAAIHEATKTGGYMLHQVPTAGWHNHGYFCYHPLFFKDIVAANGYELLDMFWTPAQPHWLKDVEIPIREEMRPFDKTTDLRTTLYGEGLLPTFNINVLIKKTSNAPFKVALEIATTHAQLDPEISKAYSR
tara:strand:- start:387 stop:1184 length:798 start_codon:yes stop_codon:yes gene_type:complete